MQKAASVLLVDDDPSLLSMLSLTLRREGFSVETALSGEEALKKLSKQRFNWLVTDARMEPMSGFQLARKARKADRHLRICMISAVYDNSDAAGAPVENVFVKPLVFGAINELMDLLRSPASSAKT